MTKEKSNLTKSKNKSQQGKIDCIYGISVMDDLKISFNQWEKYRQNMWLKKK